ncbi:Zn-dependent hydrolase [Lacicoccus qingdaonensis]|uniref:N-carbamoyl-L-amino-acid hydrolase n=1 Tax=Lacicoccus qingdaonensis TaxID=576118 RepID=A0A1G9IPK7_9BACL|nr:Zn-dependent hydrolase [Salinicoccus qingdaonensis]SDL27081.1 N-carbamoyl-L-amino-acid hydrolase [Salinicoccus qingdaonensis]
MKINSKRLLNHLDEVNMITADGEGMTRPAFSGFEDEAHEWFIEKCKELNLRTHQDAFGNSFATIGPEDKKGILIGSHLDTVNNGGRYDGALGVVTALEVALTLLDENAALSKPVTVVAFRAEEIGLVGSSVFTGLIDRSDGFEDRLKEMGRTIDAVDDSIGYEDYTDYVELHIEQGKNLETKNIDIGVVSSIASLNRMVVTVHGEAGHAGTIGMEERNDALMHTAKILTEFERIVKSYGPPNVGTVGQLEVSPASSNVIPGEVRFTIDLRGDDMDDQHAIREEFRKYVSDNHTADIIESPDKEPAHMSDKIMDHIKASCDASDFSYEVMTSGANHDANPLSRRMNAGMIFILSKDGVSHNPAEFSSEEDIEAGAEVMLGTVQRLLDE